ncbi:transposable element Tcb2 transposase [Trichonephila clavipes]|nr:transposable element Tcb2 transposase [Trichonephila clavipes]
MVRRGRHPELAPPLLTTTPTGGRFSYRFNVHRCPTRRVFSGTGLEPVTKQATELVRSGTGVWKQWTDEHRTGSGQLTMTSARDNRHMLRMAVKDRTASSWQLAARWSTATGVLMSASLIRQPLLHRGLCVRVPLYRIPSRQNHRRLRLQWVHEHRAWQADWHQVVFSDE